MSKRASRSLSLLGIADAAVLLRADELNEAIAELRPEVLLLGNEFKTTLISATPATTPTRSTVQFHAGDIHYATAIFSAALNVISANKDVPSLGGLPSSGN